ncbi:class I SAM-dependent methyltransferase [Roseibium sp. Sym1]|uniref:class I SAM-dependent methyltransferase n=1 Tax=Roseibium sp. Sym1 TaxID=3016006 RepID=UPI0022B524BA|nr:methyltransferase domain-containing protein [Roseibium sp. Sym1]
MSTHESNRQNGTFAERYDSVMVPVIFQPWAREMLRRQPPSAGDRILDLACGTGAVTREVARQDVVPAKLAGVDMSAGMLAVAAAKAGEAGIMAEWFEADAGNLPFAGDTFDLAYCQQALQFFPDRVGALRELHRVLAEGARVAFCVSRDLSENPLLRAQSAALEKHAGPEAGAAVRAICQLSDPQEIRANFDAAGFREVSVETVSLQLHHPDGYAYAAGAMGGMHTGDKLSLLSDEERRACFTDFLAELGDCYDGKAIRFPHVSNVVTAQA